MEDVWVRAVESAIDGRTIDSPVKTLTLDGTVTCFNGRLPPPILFERYQSLVHLSIANVGLTSLEMFPRLWNLQRLVLSDNLISGGLEFLVEAGLRSLRDLDLSNNRIESVGDLLPLAQLALVSLDLHECPVTRVRDYRVRILGLIKSLKCLDKLDDEDDGEIDGTDVDLGKYRNGSGVGTSGNADGIIEESDEDGIEEERDELRIVNVANGDLNGNVNGYRVGVNGEDEDGDDHSEESEGVEEGVEEVQEIEESAEEEEGVENGGGDNVEYENEEEVEHLVLESSRTMIHSRGEIDGHEEGEEDSDNDGEYEEDGEEDEVRAKYITPLTHFVLLHV